MRTDDGMFEAFQAVSNEKRASKPISRILSPAEAGGDHSSSPGIATRVQRPTREWPAIQGAR